MRDEVGERVRHQPVGQRLDVAGVLELEQQALPEIARADAGRVELLDDGEHLLGVSQRVLGTGGERGRGRGSVGFLALPDRRLGVAAGFLPGSREVGCHELIDRADQLLEGRREIAVFGHVAEELLGEEVLARRQLQHAELLPQMIGEIAGLDGDGLGVFLHLELLAGTTHVEPVEEDLLPVHLLFLFLLLLLLFLVLGGFLLRRLLVLRLEQLEEWIGQQLLLQVLLEIHHGHVEHVHGLVEPRIDPQLLAQARLLRETGSEAHAAGSRRARRRDVSVGPRYRSATRSS